MAEKPQPVRVLYCQVCGLPAEYCEFGPDFEKCKPWLIQNAPDLYPDILKGRREPSKTLTSFWYLWFVFCFPEENENEADKVSDRLQTSSISDGTAPSGNSMPGYSIFLFLGFEFLFKFPELLAGSF